MRSLSNFTIDFKFNSSGIKLEVVTTQTNLSRVLGPSSAISGIVHLCYYSGLMVWRVFKKVYGEGRYFMISGLAFLFLILLAAWVPNLGLVKVIPIGLIMALPSTLGLVQFIYLLIIAVLFAISLSFSIFYIHVSRLSSPDSIHRIEDPRYHKWYRDLLGLVLAVLGLGCASCGSLILTPILGLAAGGLLAALPLGGGEFAVLGIGLMLWSLYVLIKKIDQPYGS